MRQATRRSRASETATRIVVERQSRGNDRVSLSPRDLGEEGGAEMLDGQEGAEEGLALATAAVRTAAVRLLGKGEASPRLVARLLARVAGELGTEASLAGGTELEASLALLAEALRR